MKRDRKHLIPSHPRAAIKAARLLPKFGKMIVLFWAEVSFLGVLSPHIRLRGPFDFLKNFACANPPESHCHSVRRELPA